MSPRSPSSFRFHSAFLQGLRTSRLKRYQSTQYKSASLFDQTPTHPATKHVIFSGIQPTGIPHLGNYLGALRQWQQLQQEAPEDAHCIYCIVDLHALTTINPQEAQVLQRHRRETLASLLAIGLDQKKSTIFFQSSVSAHSELMWLLSCNASMGYLSRMTQWKSKMSLSDDASITTSIAGKQLKLGLFSYPVLQAADILLYQTTEVPVGEDQRQHIEFARELANGFNYLYGDIFVPPNAHTSPAKRIMSFQKPTSKMSKSDLDPLSRILLTDSKEAIFSKVNKARTDSISGITYEPEARPGVSNLVEILYHLRPDGAESCEEIAADMKHSGMRTLKENVAQAIEEALAPIREKFNEIMSLDKIDQQKLDSVAEAGRLSATARAEPTMHAVRGCLGIGGYGN